MKKLLLCIVLIFILSGCIDYKSKRENAEFKLNLACIELGYNYALEGKTLEEAKLILFEAKQKGSEK